MPIARCTVWPPDFPLIAGTVAHGLRPFYGELGAQIYRDHAEPIFAAYLSQQDLRWWVATVEGQTVALVLTRLHQGRGEVTLGHRMPGHALPELEEALVLRAIKDLRQRGASCVLAEFMPTSDFDGLQVLRHEGFRCFPREFMQCPIGDSVRAAGIRAILRSTAEAAAECIVAAYRGEEERLLHRETHDVPHAAALVQRALAGEFGSTGPKMNVGVWEGGTCMAMALGCVLAPGLGFTIQVATRPGAQGRGLARALLHAQHAAFRAAHCHAATLAVTSANVRARALYERMGYRTVRDFTAWVWNQPQP